MLAVDVATIGVAYYCFTVWDKRPIGFDCNHCGKYIASNTPWVCGFCGKPNNNANEYPFVDKCAHCHDEPKAYKCHHKGCGKIIFLTPDMLETGYAYCLNSPSEIPRPDERVQAVKQKQNEKQAKLHELEMAELDEKLQIIRNRSKEPKIKTPYDQKEESLKNFLTGVLGARELAAKQKAENAITFKDRPDDLKDANQAVDDWLTRNT